MTVVATPNAHATHRIIGGPWLDRLQKDCKIVSDPYTSQTLYPWAGLGKDEVVIYIHDDVYTASQVENVPDDVWWSCVIARTHLEPLPRRRQREESRNGRT